MEWVSIEVDEEFKEWLQYSTLFIFDCYLTPHNNIDRIFLINRWIVKEERNNGKSEQCFYSNWDIDSIPYYNNIRCINIWWDTFSKH